MKGWGIIFPRIPFAVFQCKVRRRWQHICTGMQQDSWENLVTFALCFRTGCNSNLQESSCKVTNMTSTSISLLFSDWLLFPSCRRLEMGGNSIMANVKMLDSERQFLKRTAWLLPNDWRCHESAARILHYDCWVQRDGPLLDFRVIQLATEVISVQTMWMFPCWCLNGFFVLVSHWSTPNWDSIIIRVGRGCN